MAARKKSSAPRAKKGAKKKREVEKRPKPRARPREEKKRKKPKPRPRPRTRPREEKKRKKPKPKPRPKPKPKPKPRPRPRPKKREPAPKVRLRSKKDRAFRELVRELGEKQTAKRLKRSERAIESWQRQGVPKRAAANVIQALERRVRGKKSFKKAEKRRSEEWNERRTELLAQKDSPITEAKQVIGIKLNVEGLVLGWGPGGALMRLYAIVSKSTGERSWFWTPAETFAGYDNVDQFVEFYDIDPEELEVELWFGDLLTSEERAGGGLVF